MEEIKKSMLQGEEDDDGEYLDRLREASGSGLVNTRIADRENEVCLMGLFMRCKSLS
jgi:hypothetical protein